MNGVHDMGGMHGHGPIPYAVTEPVFHEAWEGRINGMFGAVRAWRRFTLDAARYELEQISPADYLRMSYYEKWLTMLTGLCLKTGLVDAEELATGRATPGNVRQTPALSRDDARRILDTSPNYLRPEPAPARFAPGDAVRARNINPIGHTRLPRYARGKLGTIALRHGAHVFPDSNAHGLGEDPKHLYCVRFAAQEVWGEATNSHDSVHIDLWEAYLEPA